MKSTNFIRNSLICSSLLFTACSTTSPMKVALTELGTTSRSEKIKGGYKAQLAINITGLAPHDEVGTVSFDPDRFSLLEFLNIFSPNPRDIPDILSPKLTDGKSVIYESTFCGSNQLSANQALSTGATKNNCATLADISQIKKTIDLHNKVIEVLANNQIELATIQVIQTAISQNTNNTEKYLTFLKQNFSTNQDIKDATKDNHTQKLENAIQGLKIKISTLEVELDKNKELVIKPGIIITNWKLEKSAYTDANVAGLGGSYNSKKDLQGYLILSNPSVHTLHIGTDISCLKDSYKEIATLFKNKNLYVTFYQLRAKQVLYAESFESTLALQANLRLTELINTLKTTIGGGAGLKGLEDLGLTLNTSYARFSLSANQGTLDATASETSCRYLLPTNPAESCKVDTKNCPATQDCKQSTENFASQSVPVISSRFNLDKYLDGK